MAVLQSLIAPSYMQTCLLVGINHLKTFQSLVSRAEVALASTQMVFICRQDAQSGNHGVSTY